MWLSFSRDVPCEFVGSKIIDKHQNEDMHIPLHVYTVLFQTDPGSTCARTRDAYSMYWRNVNKITIYNFLLLGNLPDERFTRNAWIMCSFSWSFCFHELTKANARRMVAPSLHVWCVFAAYGREGGPCFLDSGKYLTQVSEYSTKHSNLFSILHQNV